MRKKLGSAGASPVVSRASRDTSGGGTAGEHERQKVMGEAPITAGAAPALEQITGPARKPWLWLNILCLDAPVVAITWQWLFARALGLPLSAATIGALFLTAWLIYLADRLADTFKLYPAREISSRHLFCARYRRAWITAMVLLTACDAWLLTHHLDPRVVKFGATVGTLAFLYFLLNYTAGRVWRALPVKEVTIGALFAAGTVTALLPQIPTTDGPLLLTLVLFAALCALNCISIAFWERRIDEAQSRESLGTTWPRGARYLVPGAICIAMSAVLASRWSVPLALIDSCIALSAVLLAALHSLRDFMPRDDRTAFADLVLLTPLVMMVLLS